MEERFLKVDGDDYDKVRSCGLIMPTFEPLAEDLMEEEEMEVVRWFYGEVLGGMVVGVKSRTGIMVAGGLGGLCGRQRKRLEGQRKE